MGSPPLQAGAATSRRVTTRRELARIRSFDRAPFVGVSSTRQSSGGAVRRNPLKREGTRGYVRRGAAPSPMLSFQADQARPWQGNVP